MNNLTQNVQVAMVLSPAANAFAGTKYSRVVRGNAGERISFFIQRGAGGVGTSKIQVQACDDFVPTNVALIPFKIRHADPDTGVSTDQWEDEDDLADQDKTAGYTIVAGAETLVEVIVDPRDLPEGKDNVRLALTEVDAGAVTGAILAVFYMSRNRKATQDTVFAALS